VVTLRLCYISLTLLREAPFSLVKGDQVSLKVVATNLYGDSTESNPGSGALIQYVPDSPLNLANDPATTSDQVIRFTWAPGESDGGASVIDYSVLYD